MPVWSMVYLIYAAAALAEITGCFAFWAWLKVDKSPLWLAPGMVSLALFAWLLTLIPIDAAGRTYAAYGGVDWYQCQQPGKQCQRHHARRQPER